MTKEIRYDRAGTSNPDFAMPIEVTTEDVAAASNPQGATARPFDRAGLKAATERAIALGRTHQNFDLVLLLEMFNEIEMLERRNAALVTAARKAKNHPLLPGDIYSELVAALALADSQGATAVQEDYRSTRGQVERGHKEIGCPVTFCGTCADKRREEAQRQV